MLDHDPYGEGSDVAGLLNRVDVPPNRLTATGLLRTAHRQRRRRRGLMIGASAVVAAAIAAGPAVAATWSRPAEVRPGAAVATPSHAPSGTCTAEPLPLPAGLAGHGARDGWADVTAIDPTGRYVVAATYGDDNNSPVAILWSAGRPAILPATGQHMRPVAVNAHGTVVGSGADGSAEFAWIYRDGKTTRLTLPHGYTRNVEPAAIDDDGNVIATVQTPDLTHQAVVVWTAGGPERAKIQPTLADRSMLGAGFDGDDNIVAWSAPGGPPVLWYANGSHHTLAVPDGLTTARIEAVRGHWAVGTAGGTDQKTDSVPVRWDLRTGAVTKVIGGSARKGTARPMVNLAGDVVAPHALVYRQGKPLDLPVPAGASPDVAGIDDAGTVVAGAAVTGAAHRPMLWQC